MIWQEHRETFYCGCKYDKYGVINYKTCSYIPVDKRKDKKITWEHVVAASWYGKQFPCWKKPLCSDNNGKKYKGRSCCQKIEKKFQEMEADLHNLVPAIRTVNSARSNYHFGEFYPENKQHKFNVNHCPIIIDEHYQIVEPRDEVKGFVARVHLYMADKYGIRLSEREKKLFADWNKRFSPTAWERRWNQKVGAIQGDLNPYI